MTKPLISIIVSSFNNEKYLPKCLDHLINQTLSDIEIICIDDASSDNSLAVLQDYAKRDDRIQILTNDENCGLSIVRNRGLEVAKAPYIMFCDGDDYYNLDMCEKMYYAIDNHHADLAISEINVIYHARREMKISDDHYYTLKYHGQQTINRALYFNTDFSVDNKIFKKSLIDQYHIRFPERLHYEDAYFTPAYLYASHTIYYLNERLYNYVRHASSIMSDTWSNNSDNDFAIDHIYIFFQLFDFLEANQLLEKDQPLYWELFASYVKLAIEHSKTKSRIKEIRQKCAAFIEQHRDSYNQASDNTKEAIRYLVFSKFHINTTRIKGWILKLWPTYCLEIDNALRLQSLQLKHQRLLDELNQLIIQQKQK